MKPGWCSLCRRRRGLAPSHRNTLHSLRCLAANLAQAGGLCEAWQLGREWGESVRLMRDDEWSPGCGWSAT